MAWFTVVLVSFPTYVRFSRHFKTLLKSEPQLLYNVQASHDVQRTHMLRFHRLLPFSETSKSFDFYCNKEHELTSPES